MRVLSDLRIFFYIITDRLPELLKNFTYPDLGIKFFKRLPTLFFGGSDAHVLMHYDVDLGDFMHIHFEGKKRILLFDQKQSPFLYKVPLSVHTIYELDYEKVAMFISRLYLMHYTMIDQELDWTYSIMKDGQRLLKTL